MRWPDLCIDEGKVIGMLRNGEAGDLHGGSRTAGLLAPAR
jgi:hypothetical protein